MTSPNGQFNGFKRWVVMLKWVDHDSQQPAASDPVRTIVMADTEQVARVRGAAQLNASPDDVDVFPV